MLLSRLQQQLGAIYDVPITHDVYDFLVTDRCHLPKAARGGTAEEELLVAQPDGGGELGLALYLDAAVLQRLTRADPLTRLDAGNVADYWTVLEGVSHFMYLAWNAHHDRPVSLLELEMQAEVDKYVASCWLLRAQAPHRFPAELRRALFERTHVDPRLSRARAGLYREASRYAEKFCRRIERALARRSAPGGERAVLAELRRFYRLPNARKRAHIEGCGA